MREYATKIRKIQGELHISVASFPNLGIAWARVSLFFMLDSYSEFGKIWISFLHKAREIGELEPSKYFRD
jgi:hypothetical protein